MRIGILTATAAPGIDTIVARAGDLYEITDIVSCKESTRPDRNLNHRGDYDRANAERFRSLETDYVFLLGYPWIVTSALLDAFPNRIIVVHDGDRKWIGVHAVLDAILAGEPSTRSSVFFASDRVEEGPLLLQSERYPVAQLAHDAIAAGDYDTARSYAHLHRTWMRRSWGDLVVQTVEHLALGDVRIAGDTAWIDGVPGPCRHGEAPDICHERGDRIQRGVPASCPFISRRG
jgi:folate-dependent phosphoribosylglycinamide formyltransferase PurN